MLGADLNSDGEVNPMELADNTLKGPKLIRKGSQLGDYVPFNVQEASIFVNGDASTYESLKSYISSGYVVIYYNHDGQDHLGLYCGRGRADRALCGAWNRGKYLLQLQRCHDADVYHVR